MSSALETTAPARFEVNSYWGGGPLTRLELVCLSSFVQNGAHYNLYLFMNSPGQDSAAAAPL